LETIQKLLGHASMATTAVYMEPDLEELEEAAEVY
jgi:site-specific recombinase XerD